MDKKTVNRTRNKEVKFRLTEKELENLNQKILKSKMGFRQENAVFQR